MKQVKFKQVELLNKVTLEIAWIPEQFAVRGLMLVINGEVGWLVSKVYPTTIDNVYLAEYIRDAYRTQREASDV